MKKQASETGEIELRDGGLRGLVEGLEPRKKLVTFGAWNQLNSTAKTMQGMGVERG